jgi:hypothetical protein
MSWIRLASIFMLLVLSLMSCSTFRIAYNRADFFLTAYAKDYLDLEPSQIGPWEPLLATELERHRTEELPVLAAYVEQVLLASRQGFDERNLTCLLKAFHDIYRRHARIAVTLASPLLAGLSPSQVKKLNQRFIQEAEEDLAKLAEGGERTERERRIRRVVDAIEDWTGPLNSGQQALVAESIARMPETRKLYLDYRGGKRSGLIALLEAKGDEAGIRVYLREWLVEWSDLPPNLEQARGTLNAQIVEFLTRLAASLDKSQLQQLDKRLRGLRDDLMKLQRQPRMATLAC